MRLILSEGRTQLEAFARHFYARSEMELDCKGPKKGKRTIKNLNLPHYTAWRLGEAEV
jgi:hypothetical protein